jgi:hypothetical protein
MNTMEQPQSRSGWTLASWVLLAVGTMLACALPLIDARPGVLAYMWQTLAALVVGLLAPVSGVAGIVCGLVGEAVTKKAGATSAMAAVWANVTFVIVYVVVVLYRLN